MVKLFVFQLFEQVKLFTRSPIYIASSLIEQHYMGIHTEAKCEVFFFFFTLTCCKKFCTCWSVQVGTAFCALGTRCGTG